MSLTVHGPKRFWHRICDRITAMFGFWACTPKIYGDRKSTRLNSSHVSISYAVVCVKQRLATWLELRALEPNRAIDALRSARIREVKHPGHPYYFMAPVGLVSRSCRRRHSRRLD